MTTRDASGTKRATKKMPMEIPKVVVGKRL